MTDVVIPSLGIAMEEALLTQWLLQPGDTVAVEEPVAEIETDKATMDLTAPVAGVLGPHLFDAGATVPVGAAIARIYADLEAARVADEPSTAAAAEAGDGSATPAPAAAEATRQPDAGGAGTEPRRLSPRARRALREQDANAAPGQDRFRSLIAEKVAQSWREIPHFAVTREIDAEALMSALADLRAREPDVSPTLTDLLLRALAQAIRRADHKSSADVGLAVATEHGVVIPVVRDVLSQPLDSLSRARADAVERARAGRLDAHDLAATPSTTLSNLGARGVDQFTGIIATGQTSLLTVGRAVPRAAVLDGSRIAARTTFFATVNADHRTIDGAGAADLLEAFATAVETPSRLFEEEA